MNQFIPDHLIPKQQSIPYFEDLTGRNIPGWATEKSLSSLLQEIVALMHQMGAFNVFPMPGTYADGGRVRYGFQINFGYGQARGRIECAALPLRKDTKGKKDRALAQAVFLLRDELQAMVYASIHKPGAVPLVPYLIGTGGKTVTEALAETGNLPLLSAPSHHVDTQ